MEYTLANEPWHIDTLDGYNPKEAVKDLQKVNIDDLSKWIQSQRFAKK